MRYPLPEAHRNLDSAKSLPRVTAIQKIDGVEHCIVLEREGDGCYREIDVRTAPSPNNRKHPPIPALYAG